LAESFGGKMEVAYWFPAGSEFDGTVIFTFPDEVTGEAQNKTYSFAHRETLPKPSLSLMTPIAGQQIEQA
jgi:hypothetical protein